MYRQRQVFTVYEAPACESRERMALGYERATREKRWLTILATDYVPVPQTECWLLDWAFGVQMGTAGSANLSMINPSVESTPEHFNEAAIPDIKTIVRELESNMRYANLRLNPDHIFLGTRKDNITGCIQ